MIHINDTLLETLSSSRVLAFRLGKEVKTMAWQNQPMEFTDPVLGDCGFMFPVNVIEDHGDGTYTCTTDEDRLGTVSRILLDSIMS